MTLVVLGSHFCQPFFEKPTQKTTAEVEQG